MRRTLLLFSFCFFFFGFAHAQTDYPTKPIHFIVGPGPDSLARLFGQKMSEAWGQPVIVDQRGGGGGTISAEAVAKGTPDGYWLLLTTGTHAINASVYKTSYDLRDFAPVTLLGATPFVLAVHPSVPVKSVAELIKLAKAQPGKLNYGSGGSGTPPHLATELFKQMAGVNMVHVPYKTIPAAITDLLAGQIQVMFTVGPAGLPHVKAGRIRGLAVSTIKRSAFAPDLPTVAESGLPGFNVFGWNGVLVTAGTPRPVIEKLHSLFITAMKDPEVRKRMADFGFEPIGNTPEEFGAFVKEDIARWAKLVKETGAKVE
jgi:tripartite-type tricarboxylate transporter receptor subunit TctC